MVCKRCKFDFCWVCLGSWEPHGSSWYVFLLAEISQCLCVCVCLSVPTLRITIQPQSTPNFTYRQARVGRGTCQFFKVMGSKVKIMQQQPWKFCEFNRSRTAEGIWTKTYTLAVVGGRIDQVLKVMGLQQALFTDDDVTLHRTINN